MSEVTELPPVDVRAAVAGTPVDERDAAIEAKDAQIRELTRNVESRVKHVEYLEERLVELAKEIAELKERLRIAEDACDSLTLRNRNLEQAFAAERDERGKQEHATAIYQAAHNDRTREAKTRSQVEELLFREIDQREQRNRQLEAALKEIQQKLAARQDQATTPAHTAMSAK